MLKTLHILICVLMLLLRIRTYGWIFFLMGYVFLGIALIQGFVGWQWINYLEKTSPTLSNYLILWSLEFWYALLFLVQADYGDTEESQHVVLQYLVGKGKIRDFAMEHFLKLSYLFGGLLTLHYAFCFYFLYYK